MSVLGKLTRSPVAAETVVFAEEYRGCLHSELDVIVAIDHRVFGVVCHHPEQVHCEEEPAAKRDRPVDGGESHRNAERKRDAQESLRKHEKALEKRIGDRDRQRRQRKQYQRAIEPQDQQEGAERQRRGDDKRLPRRDLALRQWPARRALDMRVEVAIGVIVERTARRAHQQRSERENADDDPRRFARRCQP